MITFGTGGFRAIIGEEFTKANLCLLARGMADKMEREGVAEKGIVMGYDRRFLSKEAMRWMAQVFADAHIRAYLVNQSVPTPLVMYYVKKHGLPYGIMVTASHNPAVYNGVKVFTAGGRDADESQTADLERYIKKREGQEISSVDYEKGKESGYIQEIYPLDEYLDAVIATVDMAAIRKARMKVALDPMYGVSETALKTILITARCQVITIHDRHDTLFGGKLPAPSAELSGALKMQVMERQCHIGIATDGDADRIGVIDDKGNYLHPNDILVLLYYYLVKYKRQRGPVVRNMATTHMLDKVAKSFGQVCYEVPVGFKHISAKMAEKDALLGGESSGGLTVRGHINGKDGVYAAMLLVEMLAVTGERLSGIMEEIHREFGKLYMEERDYTLTPEKKQKIYQVLLEERKLPKLPEKVESISYLDGSKVYFQNGGWVVARFSGTEPLLRIFCEMPAEGRAQEICRAYEEFLGL